MSVYLVNSKYIGLLAKFIGQDPDRPVQFGDVAEIAKKLAKANIASVSYWRRESLDENKFVQACQDETSLFGCPPYWELWGIAICLKRQSDRHPNWKTSEAYRIIEYASETLADKAFTALGVSPGWDYS